MFAAICICWWWENRWLLLVFEALWRWNGKVGAIRQPFCQWIVIRKCQGRCLLALMPVPMALKALRRLEYCLDSGGGIWFLPCGIAGAPSWAGGERQVETTPVTENSIFIGSLMNKSTSCIGSMGTWVLWWTTPSSLPPPPPSQSNPLLPLPHPAGGEKESERERERDREEEEEEEEGGTGVITRVGVDIAFLHRMASALHYLLFLWSGRHPWLLIFYYFFLFCFLLFPIIIIFLSLPLFFLPLSLSLSLSLFCMCVCVCVCVCVCWMRFLVTSRQLRR